MGLFLKSQFYSVDLYVSPYASATLSWVLCLGDELKLGSVSVSFLLFMFKIGYSEPLAIPYEL